MGSIAEVLALTPAVRKPTGGTRCRLSQYLDGLDDDDQAAVLAMVHDRSRSQRQISDILAGIGLPLDPQMIGRHQSQQCRTCYPLTKDG